MSNIEEDREFLTSLASKYFKYETPNPGQIEAAVEAVRLFRSGIKHVILQAPTGCHAKGHKILMYDGSLKKIEDIVIGDTVMGPNSEPKRVLDLVRGRQEMRRIIPKNGSSFVVNKDHKINSYVTCQGKEKWESSKEEVISIAQYESSSKWFRHIHKLQRKSVEFNESNQTIHPYILGILIGDGTLCKKNIMLTNADIEVQEIFKSYLKQLDLTYSVNVRTVNIPCEHIGVSDPMSTWKVPNRFTEMIKSLGLYGTKSENKFIPFNYKIASREQRLELFAGLLDTDGHLPNNSNCFEYSTASKQLGDDIAFLARSLGFMVSMNSKDSYYIKDGVKIKCQKAYRIHISGDLNLIPTKVKRKVGSSRKQIKNHLVCGFEVENLPVDDYYGMTLDGDHLYLDEEFVVHHNCGKSEISHVVHKMMRHLKDNHRTTILTASKGLQDQLVEDYKDMFDLKGRANYSCPYDKAPYNSGACRAHVNRGACKKNVECPYIIRRIQWCNKAEIRTTNNSFQIEAPPEICMKPENKANLIIIDECDTIDDAITEHTS
ncbi:MAG TPA: Hint domain-containing homing endonuclease, partial [Nitrososphaeraceae archaeon]